MSRPLRVQFSGALYHVMARGNEQAIVFADDADRERFLKLLSRTGLRLGWRLWAYCLMPNHYHLLLETLVPSLSAGMRDLNGVYSQAFNRRHDRVGHLFQGRYKSLLVDKESYALQVVRYIVRNPVRAGFCARPADWRWSSHRATMGEAAALAVLAPAATLALFGSGHMARGRYLSYVEIPADDAPRGGQSNPVFVGDQGFVDGLAGHVQRPSREVRRSDRAVKPLAAYAGQGRSRDEAIREAYASGDHSQVRIARFFGMHYSTVSRAIRAGRCSDSRPDPNDRIQIAP